MPFGRKARSVRAYEFGCLLPIGGEDIAIGEMQKRTRLWNQLVELDRRYDEKREMLITPFLSTGNDQSETFTTETRAEWKSVLKRDDVKEQLDTLEKEEYEEARALWLASGLYWANYEEVKLSWQQAQKRRCQYRYGCPRRWNNPSCAMIRVHRKCCGLAFHSWRQENGKLSVRWQNGLPVADVFGGLDTRLQLNPVPPEAYTSPVRAERRRAARSVVKIRVTSANRAPVWLTLPCVLHRPLPPNGLIRSASVLREKVGYKYRWKLVLIVERPESSQPEVNARGVVGIKLSWTQKPGGLRVAHWLDHTGQRGELILPATWTSQMEKVHDIQSIRKHRFNQVIAALRTWMSLRPVPDWLRECTATLSQWNSEVRLHRLVQDWQQNRFEGDETAYEQLAAWRKRDLHLWDYEANLRDQLLRSRREIYRNFAADIAKRYSHLLLDDMDIARLARKVKAGEDGYMPDRIRRNRQMAAPSELRLCLRNACEKTMQIEKLSKETMAWLRKRATQ